MIYKIIHITEYLYQDFVSFCHNQAILKPHDQEIQKLLEYKIDIVPKESERVEFIDFFGNNILQFLVQTSHKKLIVTSTALVEKQNAAMNFYEISHSVQQAIAALKNTSHEVVCAKQFLFESQHVKFDADYIYEYAKQSFEDFNNVYFACSDLTRRIFEDFEFVSGATDVTTTVEDIYQNKKGVCQDFAHFAIACVRSVGLPARYVSGYIETLPPKGEAKLIGADASHAWFSVFIPDFGWVQFDPTNNCIPSSQHIVIAYGRDYADVVPLKGVILSSGKNYLKVSVDISRIE